MKGRHVGRPERQGEYLWWIFPRHCSCDLHHSPLFPFEMRQASLWMHHATRTVARP